MRWHYRIINITAGFFLFCKTAQPHLPPDLSAAFMGEDSVIVRGSGQSSPYSKSVEMATAAAKEAAKFDALRAASELCPELMPHLCGMSAEGISCGTTQKWQRVINSDAKKLFKAVNMACTGDQVNTGIQTCTGLWEFKYPSIKQVCREIVGERAVLPDLSQLK